MSKRWIVGETIPVFVLETINGETVTVPDPRLLTHLQFRRFAGCPVCNLHLRTFVRRHAELTRAGVREVVFFHSSKAELLRHAADLPFAVVADPAKRIYAQVGAESAPRALLDPRVWWPILKGIALSVPGLFRGRPAPKLKPDGGRLGLPADLLVDTDGRLIAVKYGEHAYDQWTVDEVLAEPSANRHGKGVGAAA